MKTAIAQLWIIVKGIFGAALSFAGLLIGLPGLILQMIAELLIGIGIKMAPKEVHKDTGKQIIEEIAAE